MILRDNLWGTPEEDAFRRDFTVNSLFYDIEDFSIIDYAGGLKDLKAGRLRLIGEPYLRYKEDPVRMLRAVRFAAKLGFVIERRTLEAIKDLKEHILNANSSRLYEELLKLWISDEAEKGYQIMRSTGLFGVLFPEVEAWLSREEDSFPHTFLGSAFFWIEKEVEKGSRITPGLLFAVLLSGPIMERAKALQEEVGARLPQLFPAVQDIVNLVKKRISLPRRDIDQLKSILYGDQRFPQTSGKRPYVWLRNPYFKDAFRFFRMKKRIEGGGDEVIKWWERFIETEGAEKKPRGRRPRRRRYKTSG